MINIQWLRITTKTKTVWIKLMWESCLPCILLSFDSFVMCWRRRLSCHIWQCNSGLHFCPWQGILFLLVLMLTELLDLVLRTLCFKNMYLFILWRRNFKYLFSNKKVLTKCHKNTTESMVFLLHKLMGEPQGETHISFLIQSYSSHGWLSSMVLETIMLSIICRNFIVKKHTMLCADDTWGQFKRGSY